MSLGAATSPEVARRADRLVLAVPLGSCEQHGAHLPLRTDALVAEELCARLASRRGDVLVAPCVAIGASGEHQGFAGTLSVGTAQLAAYLTELVRSAREWCRGVVLVSGHGGNRDALRGVERLARGEGDEVLVHLAAHRGGDAHAGRTETSLVLALAPLEVRQDEAMPGVTLPLDQIEVRLRAHGVRAVSPNGVLGDPGGASAPEGEAILAAMADELCDAVHDAFGAPR